MSESMKSDSRGRLDRAFDSIINRVVTPILRHRDEICMSEWWRDELAVALVTNQVINELREQLKKEIAAIYFGTCQELDGEE